MNKRIATKLYQKSFRAWMTFPRGRRDGSTSHLDDVRAEARLGPAEMHRLLIERVRPERDAWFKANLKGTP